MSLCRALASSRSFTFAEFVDFEGFDTKMCSFAGLGEIAVYLVHHPDGETGRTHSDLSNLSPANWQQCRVARSVAGRSGVLA